MVRPLKLRYWFWVTKAFIKRHIILVILGIVGGVLITEAIMLLPKKNQRISIGIVGQYSTSNLPSEVVNKLGQGLTKIGPDGQPLPGLASSWSVSTDLTTYKFYLLPNLKWVDGSPVKADELGYNFKDAQTRSISNSVLEITLKESYTPFPIIVSRPLFKKEFTGTGPYILKGIKKNGNDVVELELVAQEGSGKPDLTYHMYPTEASALTAWKLGEVSEVNDLTAIPLLNWDAKLSAEIRRDRFVGLFFNTKDATVSDKSLRQAIAYGIKKKTPDAAERAIGPISPDSWAYNTNLKKYDYDKKHAKEILSKSAVNLKNLKLSLSTFPSLLSYAEALKNDLSEIGLEVDIKVISGMGDDFQMLLITQAIPPDPDQYSLWHSTQSTNITKVNKPRIDKLLR